MAENFQIAAIIPTYNEVELLSACVQSILDQDQPGLKIIVVNAGQPLPPSLAESVIELKVPEDHFWTACMQKGVDEAISLGAKYVLFANADIRFLPESVAKLIIEAEKSDCVIACSSAYEQRDGGAVELLYSHQRKLGPLLYGKLMRPWKSPDEAPKQAMTIELTGGQGVLIPIGLFEKAHLDGRRFPQYASDHDLWIQARKLGYQLTLVPKAGIVNHRGFNVGHQSSRSLWARMSSEFAPESWTIMWRLRRKHQGPLIGFLTTLISFGLRWSIGLPKIIRRS